jgi:hypothetical protein
MNMANDNRVFHVVHTLTLTFSRDFSVFEEAYGSGFCLAGDRGLTGAVEAAMRKALRPVNLDGSDMSTVETMEAITAEALVRRDWPVTWDRSVTWLN